MMVSADSINGTALIIAIRRGHVDAVKALIAKGVDVNAIDIFTGETPLTLAAWYAASYSYNGEYSHRDGSIEVLEALLSAPHINLTGKNSSGSTTLETIETDTNLVYSTDVLKLRMNAIQLIENTIRLKYSASSCRLFSMHSNNETTLNSRLDYDNESTKLDDNSVKPRSTLLSKSL